MPVQFMMVLKNKEVFLTLDEAEEVYRELDKLFGKKVHAAPRCPQPEPWPSQPIAPFPGQPIRFTCSATGEAS